MSAGYDPDEYRFDSNGDLTSSDPFFTDAMNLEGELFGHSRLKKAVRERCSNSAQGICDDIMQLVMNHQYSLPQHDDVTLVAVRALD